METRRPPILGTLLQVVPAVQVQRREPWTLTLAAVERWDTCSVASFDLLRDGPGDRAAGSHPWLVVDAADDRGGTCETWFGGGYGGVYDGGEHHRLVRKFTPPLDPAAGEFRLTARLQRRRQEDGFPPRQTVTWEDPEPWVFLVALSGPAQGVGAGEGEPPADAPRSIGVSGPCGPELRRPLGVVPVVQTQEDGGWSITCIAVERYDDGFRLVSRLDGAEQGPTNPELSLRVRDDLGNDYATWSGGGNGEPAMGACHWRLSTNCAPALDPRSRELRVEIAEVRATAVEPDVGRPDLGRPVVTGTDAGSWPFVVSLD